MDSTMIKYRFNIRTWLVQLPIDKRTLLLDKVIKQSGQSKDTIRRIIYMKEACTSYVRPETKEAFCKVFGKSIAELENKTNTTDETNK
jgi:flagellar biosynthesis regulator FlbT